MKTAAVTLAGLFTAAVSSLVFAAPPQTSISSIPLTLVAPAHPQVLIAMGNSQSMDGNLSGAIMTGSGSSSAPSQLNPSSSPLNFTVPTGFTPPLNAGSGGVAPYTVSCSGNLCDNSPSRLNVAKQAVQSILNTYAGNTDFGLLTYSTSGVSKYTTWVYLMSNTGGFTFSATNTPAPPVGEYVNNPCYNVPTGNTVATACNNMVALLGGQLLTQPYMLVQNSSDDPSVNDVLYAGGLAPVCVVYGTRTPSSPYPPNYYLADYNVGGVTVGYSNQINSCAPVTGPTNAGFVPYQDQTMYAQRGFGYYGSQSASSGKLVLTLQSAGSNPTPAQVQAVISKFTPYLAPETSSTSTGEIKASAVQSPIAGMLSSALAYFNTNPPSSNGCVAQRFVIMLSDGLPTQDLKGKNWPPLGSSSAAGYGVTATFNTDGSLNTNPANTNDQALLDTVAQLQALAAKNVKTYIIGMGAGVDPSKNPQAAQTLTAMAIAGGTNNYFPATSAQQVVVQLQVILSAIQAANLSVTSAAVNSTGLKAGAVAYQAQYTSVDQPWNDWTGNLVAYPINPTTGVVNTTTPQWQSQAQIDAQTAVSGWDTNRLVATWNPVLGSGVPFRWGTSTGITTTSTLGLDLMTSSTDTQGPNRLNYLRGDQSNEQKNSGAFRNRSHRLGDIVDSNPLFIGPSNGPYLTDPSYQAFITAEANRPPRLYVGANDGMLHAIDPSTGKEAFAYVPNGVFTNLINLTNPLYNQQHQFFVDGSPAAGDVKFSDGSWHTLLVGGLNSGGKSIYALDVTNPASITTESALASSVLWEYTDSLLGLTYSRPFVALTNYATGGSNGFLVFFGSGYNNSDGNPYLYAVNAQTGALVARINLCASVSPNPCSTTLPNGLSTPVVVNRGGALNQPADTAYAGDLQGNMWKVDISNSNPNLWKVSLLFQARDASGNPQPITTAPVVSLHPNFPLSTGPVVYFGTGQFLGPPDITNTLVQSFYGVWDNSPTSPYTRSNLVQQILTDTTLNSVQVRLITNNTINWGTKFGWYIDLGSAVAAADAGERVITDPRLENGTLVFTTYVPAANSCAVGGKAFLMAVNYQNGGSYAKPQLDINNDGTLDSKDQTASGQSPVGLFLGNVYASSPTILSASLGSVKAVKLTTLSTGQIRTVNEAGGNTGRISWWQVF
ncbi:MAG: pilus assembly protein PilY [Gammaproteobacteria bacterium]|nr:pilus assembly protein PilY [Gammaproteobacteria bacterium]